MRYIHAALTLAVLCLIAGGAAAQSSKQHLDAVAKASQALDQGRMAEALQAAEAALKLGLDGDLASRAFLIRAQAHERAGRPAQAFADYNNAIWLQSLPASERKKAVDGLARVRVALGLAAGGAETASAASPAPSSGGGFGNFFENIFGGSSSGRPQPEPAPAAPQQGWGARVTEAPPGAEPQPPARQQAAASPRNTPAEPATSSQPAPRQQQAAAQPAAQAGRTAPQPQPAATQDGGGFNIVFGALSSERAARAQAQKIKAQLSDILVNRELDTVEDGSLYKIVAGPYRARSAADALCRTIKERGVECQVTQ